MDKALNFRGRGRGGFGHCGRGFGPRSGHHQHQVYHDLGHHDHGHDSPGHHSHGHPDHGHHTHGHHDLGHHNDGHHFLSHELGHDPFGHHFGGSEDGAFENSRENSRHRPRQECRHCMDSVSTKKVLRNPIDPVWTVVESKEGKFTVSIPLGKDAKPDNVKLSVRDRDFYIKIKLETSSDDGTSHLKQVFTKRVPLPEDVIVDEIKSNLTSEGVLKIEASVPLPEEVPIPVSFEEDPSDSAEED